MTNFKLKVVALVGRGHESQFYLAFHRIYPNKTYLLILDVLDFGSRSTGVEGRVRRSLNLKRSLLPFPGYPESSNDEFTVVCQGKLTGLLK